MPIEHPSSSSAPTLLATLAALSVLRLEPEWSDTKRRTFAIASRAIWTLVQTQGIGDVVRLAQIAERDKTDFNLAYTGADFDTAHPEQFVSCGLTSARWPYT